MFWSVFCAVLGLGFATESMGLFAHEANLAFAVAGLILSALLMCRGTDGTCVVDRGARRQGLAACALGLLLLPGGVTLRLFAAALWFWGLDSLGRARGGRRDVAVVLSWGCLISGLLLYASGNSLLAWYGLQSLSRGLSRIGGAVSGHAMSVGPSYNGWLFGVLALCIGASAFLLGARRRPVRLLVYFGVIAAAYLLFLSLYTIIPAALPAAAATQPAGNAPVVTRVWAQAVEWYWRSVRVIYPSQVPLLFGATVSVVVAAFLRCVRVREDGIATAGWRSAAIVALLAALASWSWTNVPAPARHGRLKVALYKEGFLNWMTPNHEMYGARSAGMFGNMPLLIERMGWKAEIVPTLTREALADKDILVIMNMNTAVSNDSLRAVHDFVDRGGSLLELGDHTFHKSEGRLLLNDPIERTSIRYVFDSAYYFVGGWLHSYQYWPHQMTDALGDADNDCGCVVGASLDIQYPATPIVIGRYGWSDPGEDDAKDRGFMGNSMFDRGEPLGDLVLVAAENVGEGRVVVVGDTSGFVNAIQAQTWPFTERVFYWLGGRGAAAVPAWRGVLGGLLLLGVVFVVVRMPGPHAMNVAVAAVSLYLGGWVSHRVVATLRPPPALQGRVATVDLSHVGLHSIEGWRDNGISGVYLNLMREGWFTIGLARFDPAQIMASDLFVTIAPTTPYTASELRVLRQFIEQGGTLLVSVGWEQRAAAQSLLDLGELKLLHRPLGRASTNVPNATVTPQFWNAWPVLGGDPLVSLRGDPTIVQKKIGRGRLVVVGDSYFFHNRNLEGEEGGILPNIQFFGWLLKQITPEATP